MYKRTLNACYLGYVTQAIVNHFAPLLFLTFSQEFDLSLTQITLITTINFLIQLVVDLVSVFFVDRVGYRICMILAHALCVIGLCGLGFLPYHMAPLAGILVSVVVYAIGGGLLEVLVSPIVEACPTDNKEQTMSFLHSFYCWGFVLVVAASTLFFVVFGISRWRILALLWALIPLRNVIAFFTVPLYPIVPEDVRALSLSDLIRNRSFWLFAVVMLCAGAAEHSMSQWSSAFAEAGLHVPKTVGDVLGPCLFAVLMGVARLFYAKRGDTIPLRKMITFSALLCVACYAMASLTGSSVLGMAGLALCGFSVGIFWPGTLSLSASLIPGGGTAMFAMFALFGDLGCSAGPTMVGMVADAAGGQLRTGLACAGAFPLIILVAMLLMPGAVKK